MYKRSHNLLKQLGTVFRPMGPWVALHIQMTETPSKPPAETQGTQLCPVRAKPAYKVEMCASPLGAWVPANGAALYRVALKKPGFLSLGGRSALLLSSSLIFNDRLSSAVIY